MTKAAGNKETVKQMTGLISKWLVLNSVIYFKDPSPLDSIGAEILEFYKLV